MKISDLLDPEKMAKINKEGEKLRQKRVCVRIAIANKKMENQDNESRLNQMGTMERPVHQKGFLEETKYNEIQ